MLFVDLIILHLASPVNAGRKEKHMVSNTRPNRDIRRAAAFSGVCLWQIADSLGITDANFSRKLRRELPADEKEKIMQIIKNITLPTMISVKQASAQFGLTPYFLRSLCHDGKIRYIKVSKNRWLLNAESIAEYCNGIPAESTQPDTVQGVRRVTL